VLFIFLRGCASTSKSASGFTIIYTNLDLKDAANVIARLKELGINYEIRDDGRSIAVPKAKADDARMGLAEKNLPLGGVVGWEIFDESKLGATDFDRRIQLIRAISGELSRTIRRIEGVEDARVQIVIPETRLFAAAVAPVTASVMLRLRLGTELTSGKVNGIIHLVASSVENLQPENITVIDDTGKILSTKVKLVELIPEVEILPNPIITPEVVRIGPEIVKPGLEIITPEAASEEIAITRPPITAEEKFLYKVKVRKDYERDLAAKAQEMLNRFYPPNAIIVKVNADVKSIEYAKPIKINKLTAIVLIDNRIILPKSLKDMTNAMVAAAIGYNKKRGDRIIIQEVPFHLAVSSPEAVPGEVTTPTPKPLISIPAFHPVRLLSILIRIIWFIGIILIAIAVFFIFRRILKRTHAEKEEITEAVEVPYAKEERISTIESMRSMTEKNPEKIAEMLRHWLTE
jgi:flagellar M-ring protein FliF